MIKRLVSLVLLMMPLVVTGCGGHESDTRQAAPLVVQGTVVKAVTVETVADQTEAVGTVKARNSAVIAARIPGTVTAVHVREGARVRQGQVLVSIESAENVAGSAAAGAGADEARRGVDEAAARKRLAEGTFERYQKLFNEQAVTRQEFETKVMERDVAVQGLARAESRFAQAQQAAKAASVVAGYSRVTSPLAGIVTVKSIDAGATVFPGTPLLTVEEEGRYRLEVAVPESLMGKVRAGDRVLVRIDGVVNETTGAVSEVVPVADPLSRTFTVKVEVAGKGLKSGVYGRALFSVGERKGIFVPATAVIERGALHSVWVVDKDNIARMRLVKKGKSTGERVEILSGLSDGERVVVSGVEKVADGARIQ
jgi:RND family efflux transporter MFP subunit